MSTAMKNGTMSPAEALTWVRNALVEMTEFAGNPEFVVYETPLSRPMIEFLTDRAVVEKLETNIGHFALHSGDTVRTLINQLNTTGRF